MRHALPHASHFAVTSFLKYVKEHDLDNVGLSRKAAYKSRERVVEEMNTSEYGPLMVSQMMVPVLGKQPLELHMVNPFTYLCRAYAQQGGFHDMMSQHLRQSPPSPDKPWRLCLYSDEVAPGNQLLAVNKRKVWIIYFAFIEMGLHLHNEAAWCPIAAEPSVMLKDVESGVSQIFAKIISEFFGHRGHDMSTGGINLVGPDGNSIRLWVCLDMFVQDGGAHKIIWGAKGDAGTRCCMLCKNLVSESSGLVNDDGTDLLVCKPLRERELNCATDAEIKASILRLHAFRATLRNPEYKMREQAIGFTLMPHGILEDASIAQHIRPASQFMHDWMHCIFSGGVFNHSVWMWLRDTHIQVRNIWEVLNDYVAKWHWPKSHRFAPESADLFSKSRMKASNTAEVFKCQASDGLSLLPVIALFIQTVCLRTGVAVTACEAI